MRLLGILTALERSEIIFNIIESAATTFALFGAGLWAYYRYKKQRENSALIQFSVDILFHKKMLNYWVVELIANVENKGKVQHKIYDFDFDLSSLNGTDQIATSVDIGGQVYFPNLISRGSFLPKNYKYFFVEPGLKNSYSFITRVPIEAELVILHSWFTYPRKKDFFSLSEVHCWHTSEKTSSIPKAVEILQS